MLTQTVKKANGDVHLSKVISKQKSERKLDARSFLLVESKN
jgi:hypothetical protein